MLPNGLQLAAALMIGAGLTATQLDPGTHFFNFKLSSNGTHSSGMDREAVRATAVAPEATLEGIESRATEVVLQPILQPRATTPSANSLGPKDCRTQVCLETGTHFFSTRIAANGTRLTGIAAEAMHSVRMPGSQQR